MCCGQKKRKKGENNLDVIWFPANKILSLDLTDLQWVSTELKILSWNKHFNSLEYWRKD